MPGDRKGVAGLGEHDQCDPCQVTEKAGLGEHDQCDPCQVTEKASLGEHDQCDPCQVTERGWRVWVNMINVIHAR